MTDPARPAGSGPRARIGLGTVQFGLDYGITNAGGRVAPGTAAAILAAADAAGVTMLDTAPLYGESEAAIGAALAPDHGFAIVTKTGKFGGHVSGADAAEALRADFANSLATLRQDRVYGLLFHDPADLIGPHGPTLWREMEGLKGRGLVARIGVSVYDGGEIDTILARYPIDLIQIPYNPLDHRLIEGGQIGRLADRGVEIHARSLFLQGLLLQPAAEIPPRFGALGGAVAAMHAAFEARGLTCLEGVLAAAFECNAIARFVLGVTQLSELEEILRAADTVAALVDPVGFALDAPLDARILNPARWGELE